MKSLVYYGQGKLEYEERDIPKVDSEEVLVKMKYCGLCGTDIHKIIHDSVDTPVVLGHEAVGEIVDVGLKVDNFEVGDRVFFAHHVPCFTCSYCLRGKYSLCKQFTKTNIYPGGFSEYIKVPKQHVKNTMHIIPKDVSFLQASMIEPLACCIYGLRKIDFRMGDEILIMGAGQIGILFVQLLRYLGAQSIIVSDISNYKLEKALELGADIAIDVSQDSLSSKILEHTQGKGVRTAIICSSVSSLLVDAMNSVQRGGQILVFSPFSNDEVSIDANRFFNDEIAIVGSYSSSPYEYDIAMNLIRQKKICIDEMITHIYDLSKFKEALDVATNTENTALKILIST